MIDKWGMIKSHWERCRYFAASRGGERMAGKAEYKNQWQKENCDRINLTVPKGRKDEIKAHAERRGESVNAVLKRASDETIEREA